MSDHASPARLPAYILAGGRSRRFGSDKARAVLDGRPLIVRVARQIEPVAGSITVVADAADKYADLGLATVADDRPGLGPITGLATALKHLEAQRDAHWLLLLACDFVRVRPQWIAQLQMRAVPPNQAVAFRADSGWEPMPALYHVSLAAQIGQRLDRGERAMQSLLNAARAAAVPLPADWPTTPQINTPRDHQRAREGA